MASKVLNKKKLQHLDMNANPDEQPLTLVSASFLSYVAVVASSSFLLSSLGLSDINVHEF